MKPPFQPSFALASSITALNALVASGFAVAGLAAPQSILPAGVVATEGSRLFAFYAAARTLPLALIVLGAIYKRSAAALIALGWLAGIVQLADAAIGFLEGDAGKVFGPLVLAGLQFYAVVALRKFAASTLA